MRVAVHEPGEDRSTLDVDAVGGVAARRPEVCHRARADDLAGLHEHEALVERRALGSVDHACVHEAQRCTCRRVVHPVVVHERLPSTRSNTRRTLSPRMPRMLASSWPRATRPRVTFRHFASESNSGG